MQTHLHNSVPANSMVERFHCQLKAALKAYPNSTNWNEYLPFILPGIRASIKEDIGHTPAELLYGRTLTLPGQMVAPISPHNVPDPTNYVHRLREFMSRLFHIHPRLQSIKTHPFGHQPIDPCIRAQWRCNNTSSTTIFWSLPNTPETHQIFHTGHEWETKCSFCWST